MRFFIVWFVAVSFCINGMENLKEEFPIINSKVLSEIPVEGASHYYYYSPENKLFYSKNSKSSPIPVNSLNSKISPFLTRDDIKLSSKKKFHIYLLLDESGELIQTVESIVKQHPSSNHIFPMWNPLINKSYQRVAHKIVFVPVQSTFSTPSFVSFFQNEKSNTGSKKKGTVTVKDKSGHILEVFNSAKIISSAIEGIEGRKFIKEMSLECDGIDFRNVQSIEIQTDEK